MKNETAIVSGSTSGIGKKIAELFLKEGCKVAICSRNENRVKETLTEFKEKFGDSVIGATCDVSDPNSVKSFIEKTIETFGSVRILVANAGLNLTYGPLEYIPFEKAINDAKTVIGINLIGTINSISAVLPQMVKQRYGRIVTLGGAGADRPMENMTFYSASKGGILSFSKCLAKEFEANDYDIKINIFFPGMIATNLYKNTQLIEGWTDQETYQRDLDMIHEHVATDIEESCSKVIPFVLPSCKDNGKSFRGFSVVKLIKGFRKLSKERKKME
ncbi:MAG: SDR family oxidoreductase [Candidatus Heimdallarchaeota archaeon]